MTRKEIAWRHSLLEYGTSCPCTPDGESVWRVDMKNDWKQWVDNQWVPQPTAPESNRWRFCGKCRDHNPFDQYSGGKRDYEHYAYCSEGIKHSSGGTLGGTLEEAIVGLQRGEMWRALEEETGWVYFGGEKNGVITAYDYCGEHCLGQSLGYHWRACCSNWEKLTKSSTCNCGGSGWVASHDYKITYGELCYSAHRVVAVNKMGQITHEDDVKISEEDWTELCNIPRCCLGDGGFPASFRYVPEGESPSPLFLERDQLKKQLDEINGKIRTVSDSWVYPQRSGR